MSNLRRINVHWASFMCVYTDILTHPLFLVRYVKGPVAAARFGSLILD